MRKKVAVLGVTGSIGTQALEVIASLKDSFQVVLISGHSNTKLLNELRHRFDVKKVYAKEAPFLPLKELEDASTFADCDIVINGIVGLAGLLTSIAVLQSGATLATANKESIVCGWQFLQQACKQGGSTIVPIDSEHSTIFRCLQAVSTNAVSKIILTASGGAFRDCTKTEIAGKKAQDALMHPVWRMGKKVTIDSATLMNKGLEIIEAQKLFGIDNIDVIGHRESIVHSMIQLADNTYIAGLSTPDMRIPISYALTYPYTLYQEAESLDLAKMAKLSFFEIDENKFPCLRLARWVSCASEAMAVVLNAANEVLVGAYLANAIGFYDIANFIEDALIAFSDSVVHELKDIFSIDKAVREYTIKKASFGG